MADCASLLDEELSSFVFNYLTENSGSQYGEEEVCSDRLDTDFPDIDLSQLDASDFDSVSCLSALHWCHEQAGPAHRGSAHRGSTHELFEIGEENAALLAALTDSLDGMVDNEVGGLSVFPTLGDETDQGQEEERDLPLDAAPFSHPLGAETNDPSMLKKLLLTPPNAPTGNNTHRDCSHGHRYGNRSMHPRLPRTLVKSSRGAHKPGAVRPVGRRCEELHRHLTSALEEQQQEEEQDSESEEESEEGEESEEEGEESGSEAPPPPPLQWGSQQELASMVELVRYMHTYCLPGRKQALLGGGARGRPRPQPLPQPRRPAPPPCAAPRRPMFALRRREARADSLLRSLLQGSACYDVSRPYRLHLPPYAGPCPAPAPPSSSCSPGGEDGEGGGSSFSVRRSRRLASCPRRRFAKRAWPGLGERSREGEGGRGAVKEEDRRRSEDKHTHNQTGPAHSCCHAEKRACLCLSLNTKTTGEAQYSNKPFEATLSVDLCGTAGLTPPTTPPHKPAEDELFKPQEAAPPAPSSPWAGHAQRKLPEQTELYAQLRGGAVGGVGRRAFGDHDYCLLSLAGAGMGEGGASSPLETEATPPASEEEGERSPPFPKHTDPREGEQSVQEQRDTPTPDQDNCQVFYIHNLPSGVSMLRRRFQAVSHADDWRVVVSSQERCGIIKLRPDEHRQWRERDGLSPVEPPGGARLVRKRYIDLDEAGPGPIKSKYDALDFDTLLKEAQKSLHR